MTQEEKNILLKDLCARLPYGVKVLYWHPKSGGAERRIGELVNVDLRLNCAQLLFRIDEYYFEADSVSTSKPYLRPMSSMTRKEVKEIQKINWQFCKPKNDSDECFVGDADDGYCSISQMADILEYLNAHHLDYRGLIPMGLALEAPKDMYEIQKEEKDIEEIKIEIPKNLEEALSILNEMVSDEDKEYLKANGAISAHFSLGMWIRNNFGLWDNSEFYEYLFNEVGLTHPDDMSNYVIEEFIKTL